jgi:hypothetical protein
LAIKSGHLVLHFRPLRYARWAQALEVTRGELMAGGEPPLLKKLTNGRRLGGSLFNVA